MIFLSVLTFAVPDLGAYVFTVTNTRIEVKHRKTVSHTEEIAIPSELYAKRNKTYVRHSNSIFVKKYTLLAINPELLGRPGDVIQKDNIMYRGMFYNMTFSGFFFSTGSNDENPKTVWNVIIDDDPPHIVLHESPGFKSTETNTIILGGVCRIPVTVFDGEAGGAKGFFKLKKKNEISGNEWQIFKYISSGFIELNEYTESFCIRARDALANTADAVYTVITDKTPPRIHISFYVSDENRVLLLEDNADSSEHTEAHMVYSSSNSITGYAEDDHDKSPSWYFRTIQSRNWTQVHGNKTLNEPGVYFLCAADFFGNTTRIFTIDFRMGSLQEPVRAQ